MKKSTSKSKTTSKAKQPALSTGKKIGLTVYFTFVFTLMGIMGLQIWMNSMNQSIDNPSITSPQQVEQTTTQTPQTDYGISNQNFNTQTQQPQNIEDYNTQNNQSTNQEQIPPYDNAIVSDTNTLNRPDGDCYR